MAARSPARAGAGSSLCEASAFLGFGAYRSGGQALRLVLYLSGDLLEFRLELATMVGAEEQFTTADEHDAQICLGAATVTAVSGRQWARGGQNSSHVASSLARRAVVPGSTSNQAENVPARGFSSKNLSEGLSAAGWRRMGRIASLTCLTGSRVPSGSVLADWLVGLFMRTCPEPKWFMRRRERDVCFTPSRDRTCIRCWTSLGRGEGCVTTALPGLGTL